MKKLASFPPGASTAASTTAAANALVGGVDISGDSPELIAFVLLKSIVQVEHSRQEPHVFDKDWLLDTYVACLAAVPGKRATAPEAVAKPRAAKKTWRLTPGRIPVTETAAGAR